MSVDLGDSADLGGGSVAAGRDVVNVRVVLVLVLVLVLVRIALRGRDRMQRAQSEGTLEALEAIFSSGPGRGRMKSVEVVGVGGSTRYVRVRKIGGGGGGGARSTGEVKC